MSDISALVQLSIAIFVIVSCVIFAIRVLYGKMTSDPYFDPVAAGLMAVIIGFVLAVCYLILNLPGR
jgi:hypothetical protein